MMNYCMKCKKKDTEECVSCDNGSLWEETKDSYHFIIAAVMFGCGMGGIIAAVIAIYW